MVITTTVDSGTPTVYTFNFQYDASGTPMSVVVNGSEKLYYVTNLQGDVVALLNEDGDEVATYSYSAYGEMDSEYVLYSAETVMASIYGAHLYRGYVYDTETDWYYLQSRYYDPEVGRFLNADAFASTGQGLVGNNMFAYCSNNPVAYFDPTGCAPLSDIYPCCIDGAAPPADFIAESDGVHDSDSLLQHILSNNKVSYYPFSGHHVFLSVEYDKVYDRKTEAITDAIISALGRAISKIPHPIAYGVSKAQDILGKVSLIIPFIPTFENPFPDGKYLQYKVTATWTTYESPYDGVWLLTKHTYIMTYVWNGTDPLASYWHLLKCDYSTSSYTNYG